VVVQTRSGRIVTGLPIERNDAAITLADAKGERQTIGLTDIEELHDSAVSLMPENLYRQFKPQELRDLFAYLQAK
jgi:putative heme-binding domain-containing protein